MRRWKAVLALCLSFVCMGVLLSGCGPSSYTPDQKSQAVSSTALGKDGVLRVGVNANSAPLAGQSSGSSRIVGIDVDVAAYIADELGVKLELVDVGSDPEGALKDGKVDVVMGVDSSDSDASYWRSDSYLQTGVALFAPSSTTSVPTTSSNTQIAAQASSKSAWRVSNLFGDGSLVSETDLKSAFSALSSGSAQYVAADAVIGEYVAHTNGYDATIVALLQDPSGYCVGVSTSNTELQSAVSTVVKKLASGGVGDIIEAKWLGSALNLNNVTVVKGAATTGSASTTAGTTSTTGTAGSASATGSATSTGTTGTTTATGATGSTGATSTTAATGTTN